MNHLKWNLHFRTIISKKIKTTAINKWFIFAFIENSNWIGRYDCLYSLFKDRPLIYSIHKFQDTNHHLIKCLLMPVHEWIRCYLCKLGVSFSIQCLLAKTNSGNFAHKLKIYALIWFVFFFLELWICYLTQIYMDIDTCVPIGISMD